MNLIVLLCLTTLVASEMQSVEHQMYPWKSRSRSELENSRYFYNTFSNDPGTLASFESGVNNYKFSEPVIESYSDLLKYNSPMYTYPVNIPTQMTTPTSPVSKYSVDYEIAKAESKYNTNSMPSKIKSDIMYENLKSAIRYHSPDMPKDTINEYANQYRIDGDDDVRTSSRSTYDSRPYFYHSPYEYELMKMGAEIQKAKDKRYALDIVEKVIPVHEELEDVSNSHEPSYTTSYYYKTTTDNPVIADEPFFASVLNDYFYKKNLDDDHLAFRGHEWGKDFDQEANISDMDAAKRNRRLESDIVTPEYRYETGYPSKRLENDVTAVDSKSMSEIVHQKKHEYDKHEKDEEQTSDDNVDYEDKKQNSIGFKDFVDTFANQFGGEDYKKNSNYVVRKNQDKGENRKGFRRVYHKDEYQEDKEFYDNSNSSTKAEEKIGSNAHYGDSQALIKSHAMAAGGNEANVFNKSGNSGKKNIEKNLNGYENSKLYERVNDNFNKYRDIATKTAQSNNADYVEYNLD